VTSVNAAISKEPTMQHVAHGPSDEIHMLHIEIERQRGLLLLARGALLKATGGDEYGEYDHVLKQIDAALSS
jgi:hypothetical protein